MLVLFFRTVCFFTALSVSEQTQVKSRIGRREWGYLTTDTVGPAVAICGTIVGADTNVCVCVTAA